MATSALYTAAGCLVCGEKATMRCSSCFAKSGIEVKVCSQEHQRLIWPFHKLVCGERANPFRLPPFSQEEADRLYRRCTEIHTPRYAHIQQGLRKTLGIRAEDAAAIRRAANALVGHDASLRLITADMAALARASGQAGDPAHSLDFTAARIRSISAACPPGTPGPATAALMIENFISFYCFLVEEFNPADDGSLWHAHLCHHVVTDVALSARTLVSYKHMERTGDRSVLLEDRRIRLVALEAFRSFVLHTSGIPERAQACASLLTRIDMSLMVDENPPS